MISELHRAYHRFLREGLVRERGVVQEAGAQLLLERYRPAHAWQLKLAWEVAGEFLRGQARKAFALHLLLQWALRTLEVEEVDGTVEEHPETRQVR